MKQSAFFPPLAVALAAILLPGCASAPLSTIDGLPFTKTNPHLYPLHVVAIDGQGNLKRSSVQIAPGPHTLTLAAKPGKTALGMVEKTFAFKIAPCTSYHFAARRESPMQSDWELVLESTDPVVGCNADEEYKKAGLKPD